jgi:lipopolysaccharide transport system permease protein
VFKHYGFLLLLWLRRDIKSRYAGSIGGLLWAVLLPILTILIFYIVFAVVLKVRIPELANDSGYFLYLLAGLLPWLGIADGLSRATFSLATQEQFLQKIIFPINILPATAVISSLLPQLVGTIFFVAVLADLELLSSRMFLYPLVFACQIIMCLGLGAALSIISVHVKDTMQVIPVILQIAFYSAPILYPKSVIPSSYHHLFLLNPATGLVEAYQWVFLGMPMAVMTIVVLAIWTVILGLGGWLLFRMLKPTLGDQL